MNKIFRNRKVLMLVLILVCITFFMVSFSTYIVYQTSVKGIKNYLTDNVGEEKALIQLLYNKGFSKDSILRIVNETFQAHRSLGKTGEFVIAEARGGNICFLIRKSTSRNEPLIKYNAKKTDLAGPIRFALKSNTGSMKGKDYEGIQVFASYTYFEPFKWGIVSKISVEEVRHPYIIAIIYVFILALLIIFIGAYLIIRITNPMIESIIKSQENLSITLNSIGYAVITTDKEGLVCEMNPVAEKLCGYSKFEAIKKPLIEVLNIINAETREIITHPVAKVLEKGMVIGLANHTVLISREGKEYQISDSAAPIKDSKGNITGVVMVFSDITEKYLVEAAHIASETRYRRLFEAAKDGILILDAETGMIVDVNPFLTELLGYPYEKFIKKSIWEIGFFKDILNNREKFIELQQKEYRRYEDIPLETAYGKLINVEFVSNVYLVNHQKVIQCNIRDITERKYVEKELSNSVSELKASRLAALSMMEDAVEAKNALEVSVKELGLFTRILGHLNRHNEWQNLIKDILNEIKTFTGFDAVGIRLKEDEDYPYYVQDGFSEVFVKQENYLCSKCKDGNCIKDENGFPVFECTCGVVLSGKVDVTKPFATPGGSIWTNQSTDFLELSPEEEPRINPRNTCIHSGYMSIGLIPIRSGGKITGLLQLNDKQAGRFTLEYIHFFEKIASSIGIAFSRTESEERIKKSEELYRRLFENMLNGFAYCKILIEEGNPKDFIYLNVNNAFESLTGLKDVIGKKVSEVIPGIHESDPELLERYARVSQTLIPETFEIYLEALNMWFSISVYSPQQGYFVAIFDVITDRKNAERELRESEEKYSNIVNNALIGVYKITFDGEIIFGNEAIMKILEYEGDDITQINVKEHYKNPVDRENLINLVKEKGEARDFETELISCKGNTRFVIINNKLEGNILSGMMLDITARKKAEEQIKRFNKELEQKVKVRTAKLESINKELESFTYSVSHDLRRPLRHIEGFIDILRKEIVHDLSQQAIKHFEIIESSTKNMGVLIDEMLAFSKMSKAEINKNKFSTEQMVKEVINSFEEEVKNREVNWKIGNLPEINGDMYLIKQVFDNLISNAIKYTSKTKSANIEINSYKNSTHENVFLIKDNGAGFNMKYVDKLFGIFSRLHLEEDFPGIGIGLANVHKIIEKHGGRSWAEGEVGKGATFYFTLP